MTSLQQVNRLISRKADLATLTPLLAISRRRLLVHNVDIDDSRAGKSEFPNFDLWLRGKSRKGLRGSVRD